MGRAPVTNTVLRTLLAAERVKVSRIVIVMDGTFIVNV